MALTRGDAFVFEFRDELPERPLRSISSYGQCLLDVDEFNTYIVLDETKKIPHRKGTVEKNTSGNSFIHFIPEHINENESIASYINLQDMTLCQYESGLPIKYIKNIKKIKKIAEERIPRRGSFI
jgi:hypothetical protein